MSDVSITILRRVADREGTSAEELPPLHDVIDPDALDTLVSAASARDQELMVRFQYEGYTVAVRGDGAVELSREGGESQ